MRKHRQSSGFSLLELVIVVVIVGIIAAIAIPRMSRGSAGASDSALSGDLAVLRNAIDMYAAEHNGDFPSAADIGDQLLQYTNAAGDSKETTDKTYIYGPYLRKIPPLPVGDHKGCTGIDATSKDTTGWIYDAKTGTIHANCASTEKDASDTKYSDY
jgi:general secretion pathway protein G